jgi:hypothetical protein
MREGIRVPISSSLSCPVCRAKFRGVSECSRCGADLSILMQLAAQAWLRRRAARQLLQRGNGRAAFTAIQAAERLHATAEGRFLEFICAAVEPVEITKELGGSSCN